MKKIFILAIFVLFFGITPHAFAATTCNTAGGWAPNPSDSSQCIKTAQNCSSGSDCSCAQGQLINGMCTVLSQESIKAVCSSSETFDPSADGGNGGCARSTTGTANTNSNGYSNPTGSAVLGNGNITYVPLEPIPGFTQSGKLEFGVLLTYVFKTLIILAGFIAIGAFVFAGIEYMLSDAVNIKTQAKKRLQAALIGLALLLGCWLILYTINPQLVIFGNTFNPIDSSYTYIPGQQNCTGQNCLTPEQIAANKTRQDIELHRPVDPDQVNNLQNVIQQAVAQCLESGGSRVSEGGCVGYALQINRNTGQRYTSCQSINNAPGNYCLK